MSIPSYRLIHPQANRCFVLKWEPFGLTTPWHYHPEIELIYFVKGKTTGVIGQGFREFSEGDLVILGADFPHVLQKHSQFAREHPSSKPFGLIVQFKENFLGEDFFSIPEFAAVNQLLKRSRRGIIFGKKVVAGLSDTLQRLPKMTDPKALITILDILVTLGNTKDYTYLTPKDYTYDHSYDEERMQHINQYIYEHFREQILISDIAKISNMTETSFCRYFKSRTLKTFTRFLNEVRISYACKLLNNSNCSITDACFESGYNSLSYFNRQFKSILKMSPLKYKEWKSRAILSA
jgi:AraC-like DNA-binding protein